MARRGEAVGRPLREGGRWPSTSGGARPIWRSRRPSPSAASSSTRRATPTRWRQVIAAAVFAAHRDASRRRVRAGRRYSVHVRTHRAGTARFARRRSRAVGDAAACSGMTQSWRSSRRRIAPASCRMRWCSPAPRGIGKATLAFQLAHYLLSHPSPDTAPAAFAPRDPASPLYRQVASGAHPSVLHLTRPLNEKTKSLQDRADRRRDQAGRPLPVADRA